MSYMEKSERWVKFARRLAVLYVCLGVIGAIIALNVAGKEQLHLPLTGGP